jgi:hypothetical protein
VWLATVDEAGVAGTGFVLAGALAACARGCDSPYAHGTRAIFEPGRTLVGASAGMATWAVLDVALFSYRSEPGATRPASAIEPFVIASPTTGRPRVGASFEF